MEREVRKERDRERGKEGGEQEKEVRGDKRE